MSTFTKIIDSFDGSSELAQAEREALQALESLSQTKRDLFIDKINLQILDAGTGTNKTVPISSVYKSSGFARAYSSTSADDIPQIVEDSIGGFIEGGTDNILKGIFTIITRTLQVFLGSRESKSDSIEDYFLYPTDFFIYRVDMMAWSQLVSATSLRKRIEQASAYAYCMSLVDVEKISWTEFVGIYSLQLLEQDMTEEERTAAKQKMLDTWNFMRGNFAGKAEQASLDVEPNMAEIESRYRPPLVGFNG